MAQLYADENVPAQLVTRLRKLGHDVLTALHDGRANQNIADEEVLSRAIELGRCVLTNNRYHFHRLHLAKPNHAGIITFTTDPDPDALAARIHEAIEAAESLAAHLIRVTRPGRDQGKLKKKRTGGR